MSEGLPSHECPIPGCSYRRLPLGLMMCPGHWNLVPRPLQTQVYRAWNRGKPGPDYILIRQQAIDAVIDALVVK
jgi:hypothetical protein